MEAEASCVSDHEDAESGGESSDTRYATEEEGDDSSTSTCSDTGCSSSDEASQKGQYECHVCGIKIRKPSRLRQHLASHSTARLYVCPVGTCSKKYKRVDHLNRHVKLKHDEEASDKACSWPGCTFTTKHACNFKRHLKLHDEKGKLQRCRLRTPEELRPHRCKTCDKAYRYPSQLRYHEERCHGEQLFVDIICSEPGCNEHFDHPSDLAEHTRTAHKYVFCEVCGKVCLRRKIKSHYLSHESPNNRIKCPYPNCLHSYSEEPNLRKHIRVVHLERKPFKCSNKDCDKAFAYKHVRDKHERSLHICGDFASEDAKKTRKNKGGRKRKVMQSVEEIFVHKKKQHRAAE